MAKIPKDSLVVVADGGRARVFRNLGERGEAVLHQEAVLEGMNMNDEGPSGAMPAEFDGYDIDEATFAKQLAQWLNRGALRGEYADLVLAADPQTLGQMRDLLHKETRQRLRLELAKDLINVPREDVARALVQAG